MQIVYSGKNTTYLTDLYHGEVAQLVLNTIGHAGQSAKRTFGELELTGLDLNGDWRLGPLILDEWTDCEARALSLATVFRSLLFLSTSYSSATSRVSFLKSAAYASRSSVKRRFE